MPYSLVDKHIPLISMLLLTSFVYRSNEKQGADGRTSYILNNFHIHDGPQQLRNHAHISTLIVLVFISSLDPWLCFFIHISNLVYSTVFLYVQTVNFSYCAYC